MAHMVLKYRRVYRITRFGPYEVGPTTNINTSHHVTNTSTSNHNSNTIPNNHTCY